MSTKNLARTVIEGGRSHRNSWDRRASNADVRARMRRFERSLRDPEAAWSAVAPERRRVPKQFSDRLGPVYRWLDRHCGRPWAEVRSEIFRRFDTRTLAGRHIVFDHMLSEVCEGGEGALRWYRYRVDESGILRPLPRRRWSRERTWLTAEESAEIRSLAGERKIRRVGSHHFWVEMTIAYLPTRRGTVERQYTGRYRQGRRLDPDELRRLMRLGELARAALIEPATQAEPRVGDAPAHATR